MKKTNIKNWSQFITESITDKHVFNYKDTVFELECVQTTTWRVIDKVSRTWSLIHADDVDNALITAKLLIDDVFSNGRPNFHPRRNDKFIITGLFYDYTNNQTITSDKMEFAVGVHNHNLRGTGKYYAYKNDILTFVAEGDDNASWYIDGDQKIDKEYYFKYADGSDRYPVNGDRPWHLLWSKKIISM